MNGFTEIKINGQTVGLRFAYPSIKWFTEESLKKADIYFTEGDGGGFTVEGLAKLIQCSYRNQCLVKEVEPELKFEHFYEWVSDLQETEEGQKELLRVTEVYADSSVMKRMVEAQKKSQSQ